LLHNIVILFGISRTSTSVQPQDYWIGFYKFTQSSDQTGYWLDNSPVTYLHFDAADGEPNGSGYCIRLQVQRGWRDTDCTDQLSYICKLSSKDYFQILFANYKVKQILHLIVCKLLIKAYIHIFILQNIKQSLFQCKLFICKVSNKLIYSYLFVNCQV